MYPSYLIHFNRQHDPKTGKFTFGDGDGDGVSNDHKNQKTTVNRSDGNKTFEVRPNRNFTREGTGKTVRVGDTKVGNYVTRNFTREGTGKTVRVGDTKVRNPIKGNPAKGENKTSEIIGNMNATLSRNFTRTNEKQHLYGPGGYDYNAPPSNGSSKYDAEQRSNSNTLNDVDYYLRNNKLTNPIEDGKKLVDSAKDQEIDTQKITNKEATEIVIMRNLGKTLHSLYIDDYDERRAKDKELLDITNTKNWNK